MQLFFDDNIRLGMKDSIVDARTLRKCAHNDLERLQRLHLHQVDLLDAIANKRYYIGVTLRALGANIDERTS